MKTCFFNKFMNREIVLGVWLWIGPFQLGDNEVQNWKKKKGLWKKKKKGQNWDGAQPTGLSN